MWQHHKHWTLLHVLFSIRSFAHTWLTKQQLHAWDFMMNLSLCCILNYFYIYVEPWFNDEHQSMMLRNCVNDLSSKLASFWVLNLFTSFCKPIDWQVGCCVVHKTIGFACSMDKWNNRTEEETRETWAVENRSHRLLSKAKSWFKYIYRLKLFLTVGLLLEH